MPIQHGVYKVREITFCGAECSVEIVDPRASLWQVLRGHPYSWIGYGTSVDEAMRAAGSGLDDAIAAWKGRGK